MKFLQRKHVFSKVYQRLTQKRCYHELSFSQAGEPKDVLEFLEGSGSIEFPSNRDVDQLKMVEVEMLYVPWNPADVNVVQGRYASPYRGSQVKEPSSKSNVFPDRSVAGSEGIGRIVQSSSPILPLNSLVTMGNPGMGTLRSSLWASEKDVLTIPTELEKDLGPASGTIFQLGGTALRMLQDFVGLKQGETVIQNAGNSGVGVMVSQLSHAKFGAHPVSIVRRGEKTSQQLDEMIEYLCTTARNSMVLVEEDLENREYRKEVQRQLQQLSCNGQLPKLALNSVGGDSARILLQLLNDGGTLVTYGGMSAQPSVTVGVPQLIFKDIRVVGYWHSRWMVNTQKEAKQRMIDDLVKAVQLEGVSCPSNQVFPLLDVKTALDWQATQNDGIRRKLVFDCQ